MQFRWSALRQSNCLGLCIILYFLMRIPLSKTFRFIFFGFKHLYSIYSKTVYSMEFSVTKTKNHIINIFWYFFFRKNRNPTVNGKMPSVANSPTSGSDHIADGMAGLVLDNVRHPIGESISGTNFREIDMISRNFCLKSMV